VSVAAPAGQTPAAALLALLAWYREMGIDAAVADAATDWRARGEARPGADFELAAEAVPATPPQPAARTPTRPATRATPHPVTPPPRLVPNPPQPVGRQFPTASPDAATLAARDAARSARSIEDLQARLAAFDGCALKATAKSLCFYRGAASARLMVIGEAPGADEDKLGRPFVGPAGQLLDKMLAAIGRGETDAHITNIVYWRPPGNRTPTPQEAMVCRPFLERQVELVKPDVILLLGGAAAKHILDVPEGIMRLRGQWRDVEIGAHRARAMATLHPAYLLRTPIAKRLAWRDLLAVEATLGRG
jgi:DNA polymerase